MRNSYLVICLIILFGVSSLFGQRIEVTGSQQSEIQYELSQDIASFPDLRQLIVSFVVPQSFKSVTYEQEIRNLQVDLQPEPKERKEEQDKRGNSIRTFVWEGLTGSVRAKISFTAANRVRLQSIEYENVPFPYTGSYAADVQPYLAGSDQVQLQSQAMSNKAAELTAESRTMYEAVQNVLNWIVDHMQYVLIPEQYDAFYSFRTGKGNCQNYSHLAAAMLRSQNIPVRIVNGITLDRPYEVSAGRQEYVFKMAQGRHSWVEVYFPDSGWVPFDPQQSEFFVSNRYVRVEVGLDNEETISDGLIRWRQRGGSAPQEPRMTESIAGNFLQDQVKIAGEFRESSIRKMLIGPPVTNRAFPDVVIAKVEPQEPPDEPVSQPAITPGAAAPQPVVPKPEDTPAVAAEETPAEEEVDYTRLAYTEPFVYGNLDYPQGIDFAFPRKSEKQGGTDDFKLQRTFLVETAEYVTSDAQFAQFFVLDVPVKLEKIGLAMHRFGGEGPLWLELSEDVQGHPGPPAVRSKQVRMTGTRRQQGYQWVDFDFASEGIILSPGKYWFSLGYSGAPIVNWFYSYGKPVGPANGTQSKPRTAANWEKILSFEFNYRVTGKSVRK